MSHAYNAGTRLGQRLSKGSVINPRRCINEQAKAYIRSVEVNLADKLQAFRDYVTGAVVEFERVTGVDI